MQGVSQVSPVSARIGARHKLVAGPVFASGHHLLVDAPRRREKGIAGYVQLICGDISKATGESEP